MIPTINNPLATNPPIQPLPAAFAEAKKLDLKAIFSRMGEFVCQVSTLRGKCSGILFPGRQILVPFHAIAIQKIKDLPNETTEYRVLPVEISCRDTTYTATYSGPHNLKLLSSTRLFGQHCFCNIK